MTNQCSNPDDGVGIHEPEHPTGSETLDSVDLVTQPPHTQATVTVDVAESEKLDSDLKVRDTVNIRFIIYFTIY